jgi:chromosome transmission fidelity protein 18
MSSTPLAFHTLFAASLPRHAQESRRFTKDDHDNDAPRSPFSGLAAPYTVSELLRANTAAISVLQSNLSIPLERMYRSRASIATELLPYILRLLAPDIKPVIIHTASSAAGARSAPTASVRRADEKERVARAVACMAATGVRFEKARVEDDRANVGWVYRMEPGLDSLGAFETIKEGKGDGVRYAVRQVLEGEWRRQSGRKAAAAALLGGAIKVPSKKDSNGGAVIEMVDEAKLVKRDFFGRAVAAPKVVPGETVKAAPTPKSKQVWVSFHEGFSNAVRKPITLEEFMRGL